MAILPLKINLNKAHDLSLWDTEFLIELLKENIPIHECLDLIRNKANDELIEEIDISLKEGMPVNNVIQAYLPVNMRTRFSCFIQFESLTDSLEMAYKLVVIDKERKEEIIKNMIYPIILLYITVIGLYLFNLIVFPMLIKMLDGFNIENATLTIFEEILSFFSIVSLLVCIIILIIFIFFLSSKYRVHVYRSICRLPFNSLVKLAYSLKFASYFYLCHKHGCSTQRIIKILTSIANDPLTAYLGHYFEHQLLEGETMETIYHNDFLDHLLIRFLVISLRASNIDEMLNKYIKMNQIIWKRKIKQLTTSIQLISYMIIGIILIFIYQILFAPMNVIIGL